VFRRCEFPWLLEFHEELDAVEELRSWRLVPAYFSRALFGLVGAAPATQAATSVRLSLPVPEVLGNVASGHSEWLRILWWTSSLRFADSITFSALTPGSRIRTAWTCSPESVLWLRRRIRARLRSC